ncbi:hypothetical protein PoB_001690500 [Plakobranchus ocellatus]|uniref:Uncharacterized protein n=1 Tax=Plakobranchus ocellatus TaxID=259542 RepID=A0AAV3Z760_9GAST|nr:hypothetical protein PoB_001690500 [Plakobranchus ocellatus]
MKRAKVIRLKRVGLGFLYVASSQQGDLRLLGPPSGQGACGGVRTLDRRVPADLRVDSPTTVSPTPQTEKKTGIDKQDICARTKQDQGLSFNVYGLTSTKLAIKPMSDQGFVGGFKHFADLRARLVADEPPCPPTSSPEK